MARRGIHSLDRTSLVIAGVTCPHCHDGRIDFWQKGHKSPFLVLGEPVDGGECNNCRLSADPGDVEVRVDDDEAVLEIEAQVDDRTFDSKSFLALQPSS